MRYEWIVAIAIAALVVFMLIVVIDMMPGGISYTPMMDHN